MTEDEVVEWLTPIQAAGMRVAAHCNGDRAVDVFLDAVERAVADLAGRRSAPYDRALPADNPGAIRADRQARADRQSLCQPPLVLRRSALRHHGRPRARRTHGSRPDRAGCRRDDLVSHGRIGDPAGLPAFDVVRGQSCHAKGSHSGETEKITAAKKRCWAVTLGSAYLLGLDAEMGSIAPGKLADFTVLEENPLDRRSRDDQGHRSVGHCGGRCEVPIGAHDRRFIIVGRRVRCAATALHPGRNRKQRAENYRPERSRTPGDRRWHSRHRRRR